MTSYAFVWNKNRGDIRDGNEYKIWKRLVLEFHGSGHLQIILHLNKIECLKMTTFKIVFTFDVFFSAETTCTARWHVFYIRNRAVSIYTTVVQLILLGYSHDRRAANFSSAIRTTIVQLILLGYSHDRRDFHSQSCRSFLQHVTTYCLIIPLCYGIPVLKKIRNTNFNFAMALHIFILSMGCD
jgi:hypothetical protein